MKMIMAIVGKDEEMETSAQLVAKGYFVTKIATSGGFLKRKHVTLMIGTEDEKVDQAISIIQKSAGERKTVKYTNLAAPSGPISPGLNYTVPINVDVGGSTIFVMNVERFEKM